MTPNATSSLMELGPLDRFAEGAHAVALPAGVIAVYSVHGELHAIGDTCLRCGTSLASGDLADAIVQCSFCGWRYDVITGEVIGVPRLHTDVYALRIVDGMVVSDGTCETCASGRHE
ncbi:MAG TPA: Rieske 2Fe-2S domain-containing protein [Casimicrobiaceae bacterium]|jgi:nitrite reductase/ring-hydroxylating ferredoxin subunit|nr:Rieske 2Fe-2S domain-containing protein [Casimicrobiaceae bacterium]